MSIERESTRIMVKLSNVMRARSRRCSRFAWTSESTWIEIATKTRPASVTAAVPDMRKKSCHFSIVSSQSAWSTPPVLLQPQLGGDRLHRLERERDVLVEIDAELGRTLHDVVAIHVPGEVAARHLLLHRCDLALGELLRRLDQRAGDEQPRQLVARVERLRHVGVTRHA